MTLKIISAKEVIYDGEVTSVTLPGVVGEFTVLRNHATLLSTLATGSVRFVDASGAEQSTGITGGIVDIDDNVVSVCVY